MLANFRATVQLIDAFRQLGTKQTYKKGDFIIRPGETPSGVFYVKEGLVKAYDITKYGEENLLIIRKNDEIFPLIWALTGQERDVIYQALAPTSLWKMSSEDFSDQILSNAELMAPLLDMTIEMYRLHSERILNLEYRTVRERIVSFLLTLAARFGEKKYTRLRIGVPLRHQDIASSINASRETTSREIGTLERKGLLTHRQSVIILTDVEQLRSMVE
jgi:CRP/FNR family transcriptional regulator, cyclic AMP receptor protein